MTELNPEQILLWNKVRNGEYSEAKAVFTRLIAPPDTSKLASYLVKRDVHLALNKTQADQLAHYVVLFHNHRFNYSDLKKKRVMVDAADEAIRRMSK